MPHMTREEALSIFGFAENENPDEKAIKSVYKKKVLATHPDKTPYPEGATEKQKEALRKEREELFKRLGQAYVVLTKPEQNNVNNEFAFNDAEALFKSFFGESSSSSSFSFDFVGDLMPKGKYQFISRKKPDKRGFNSSSSIAAFNDLEGLIDEVRSSASQFERYAENELLHYPFIEFNISQLPEDFVNRYDADHSEGLVEALLKNTKLVEVQAPQWLFSDAQRARLDQHMQPQREAKANSDAIEEARQRKKEQFEKDLVNRYAFWSKSTMVLAGVLTACAVIGSGGALTLAIIGKAILYGVIAATFSCVVAAVLYAARFVSLTRAEEDYNAQNLNNITNPVEIEAMQLGVNATHNWEYAKTYAKLPTYTHYKAFLYGYSQAMQEDTAVVEKIKTLRAH